MAWRIELSSSAVKALKKIDPQQARRITQFLRERIATSTNPRQHGKALQGELREYWRYRVGTYHIVCHIQDDVMRVLAVRVNQRKQVLPVVMNNHYLI